MFQFKSRKPDKLESVGFKSRVISMSMFSIIRRELTDDVVFKPLTLALLVTGVFAAGLLIGGGTVFLAIAAALA